MRFGNIDRSERLTLWSIFDFFQEAAICHATNLGVGRDAMTKNGQAWILSRLSILVERRPSYREIVEVSTWPRGCEKLFALRDYQICDAEGKAVVRGRGGWLVVDIEKKRPLRPQPVVETLPPNEGINAFPEGPAGLNPLESLSKKSERIASYSDIDSYGHTNNARYIQWIQDATDMDVLTNASHVRLDINYLSEVMPGDAVELWTAPLDESDGNFSCGFAYEGRRPASSESPGQAVFRAELRV